MTYDSDVAVDGGSYIVSLENGLATGAPACCRLTDGAPTVQKF